MPTIGQSITASSLIHLILRLIIRHGSINRRADLVSAPPARANRRAQIDAVIVSAIVVADDLPIFAIDATIFFEFQYLIDDAVISAIVASNPPTTIGATISEFQPINDVVISAIVASNPPTTIGATISEFQPIFSAIAESHHNI
jgi:hypothetical protein